MSERLSPGPEARARIQALGEKQLLSFFDEVPAAAMLPIVRYLPTVAGFRKTSKAGIARQKEALARKLSKSSAQDRDYRGLYIVWRTWINEELPNAELIQELIDQVEEAAEGANGPEARRLAIEEHVASLLEKLKDESQQQRCTREQIDRLFTFSPFPDTPAARELITAAKSASEIDRDATLIELPKRLQHDEDEIQSVKSQLNALADRFEPVAVALERTLGELSKLQCAVAEVKATANDAHAAIQEQRASVRPAEPAAPTPNPNNDRAADHARIQAVADEVDGLKNALRELTSKLPNVAELHDAIGRLTAAQQESAANTQKNDRRIEDLSTALEAIKRDVVASKEDGTLADQLTALAQRLDEFEQSAEAATPRSALPYETKDLKTHQGQEVSVGRAALRWDALSEGARVTAFQSLSDVVDTFAKVLQSLGLRKTAAQIFAEECAAAVFCRQAVFLKGAFATELGRGLARAIGGPGSARLAIPIGLQDGEELRASIDDAFAPHKQSLGAVAIEGINRSALDVTKEVLSDCLAPENRAVPRVAVFATIAQGIASLPMEPGYFELGPVFDLDYLDWRANQPLASEPTAGVLSTEFDQSILAKLRSASIDTEEAGRLARSFVRKRNPSVERVVVRAYHALHVIRSDQKTVTSLQSLFYGWLLPYWRALGLSKDQIDSELDGGKCNGPPVDTRLVGMFKAEVDGNAEPGAAP